MPVPRYVCRAAMFSAVPIQAMLIPVPGIQLQLADQVVSQLGNSAEVLSAAIALVAAEKNFNNFVQSIPTFCDDASLPATAALRGIVPKVDPSVGGSDVENANSAKSVTTPFDATGLSVADVVKAQGVTNFTTQGVAGAASSAAAPPPAAASTAAAAVVAAASSGSSSCGSAPPSPPPAAASSAAAATIEAAAAAASTVAAVAAAAGSGAVENAKTGNFPGFVKSTIDGLDFGKCVPTMKFEAGLDGRKDTEFTFQAQDPLVNKGQEEALNPNIITNRICDQLTNVCDANAAAKSACTAAKAQIAALGTKDQSTADAWNSALGFAGTSTNPDNAPQAGLVGHT
jgi:hypothetical protein